MEHQPSMETHLAPPLPMSCIVSGASMSGKTYFTTQLINEWETIYNEKPRAIVVIYNHYQSAYDKIKEKWGDRVMFFNEFTKEIFSNEILGDPSNGHAIILMDDMAHEIAGNPSLTSLFIGGCHHLRLCPIV